MHPYRPNPRTFAKAPFALLLLLTLVASATFAQPAALSYFERSLGAGPETSLDLGRAELDGLADSLDATPEIGRFLARIEGVQMRRFVLAPDMAGAALATFDETSAELRQEGWTNLVSVKEADSRVNVFLDLRGETIHGLVALFTEGSEAGYASIDGQVEMTDIMGLAQGLQGLPNVLDQLGGILDSDS